MRTRLVLALFGVIGCTTSGPGTAAEPEPVTPVGPETAPDPKPVEPVEPKDEVVAATITVQMMAATLADDCGSGPSTPPQAPPQKTAARQKRSGADQGQRSISKAERRCQQSSIQLAIAAPEGVEPAAVAVKSVELFLDSGKTLGILQARAPSVWSDADGYAPWDQKIEPGQDLSVSYAVTQPNWDEVDDRRNQSYVVKAVVSIGGDDRAVEQSVTVDAPTSLPPNVRT